MSQSHFTLGFPLKAPADTKALTERLASMMPSLIQVQDDIGTMHYSRFTILSDRTLLFLGDFDGEFGELMTDLAQRAGAVFDTIFESVDAATANAGGQNAEAFVGLGDGASGPSAECLQRLSRRDREADQGAWPPPPA